MPEIRQLATLPEPLRDAIAAGSTRTLCPTCGGGRSRELSLSIRRYFETADLLKLSCFRSTCDWYCTVAVDSSVTMPRSHLKPATPYTADTLPVGRDMLDRLRRFRLDPEVWHAHGWVMSANGHALVLPVRDPYGRVRGHVTRTFDTPKRVYTYKATAQPWLDWWQGDDVKPIVIVEDCLSACRLAGLGYCAVALLGTGINVEQAKEIASIALDDVPVWLALDRDAHTKSIRLAQRHAHILRMLPVCLDLDIKNMVSDKAIHELFGEQANG